MSGPDVVGSLLTDDAGGFLPDVPFGGLPMWDQHAPTARPNATGRPDEVLLALGLDPLALPVHRTQLIFL